jgi:hypothetical protein
MKFKEIYNNPELLECIVEDIEEIPEDTEVSYEVWALGYNKEDDCTDDEVLVGEFENPDEAIAYAEKVNLEMINELGYGDPDPDTAYFSVEVETVIETPDDEDSGTMNIGSLYSRDLWIDGEYGSEEDVSEEGDDPIVAITNEDFELLEDGTLKISCQLLKGFNKNDYVRFDFVEEPDAALLTYKIMSKVVYVGGTYFHCELII